MTNTIKTICLRGHNIAEIGRYAGGQCRECHRQRVRQWKHDNRAQVLADGAARRDLYRALFGVSYVPNRLLSE